MHQTISFDENGEKIFTVYTEDEWAAMKPGTADEVKAEANRRIIQIVPEWKQRNLLAQAILLNDKGRANWTAQESEDWDTALLIWAQVEAIRTRSDAIEAMEPIPADLQDDALWE